MKEEQKSLKKKLSIVFWLNIILFIALSLFLVSLVGINGQSETKDDFMWERFGIIITVAIIPFALKLFHSQYKKIELKELDIFLAKLEQLFYMRILLLDVAIILNFVGFYFIGALNFIYLAAIIIFAFLMCYPTESMIDPVQENINTNDINEE